MKGIKSTNPIAVGDVVDYDIENTTDETTGVIINIQDRKNYIVRKSVNLSHQMHIIASNIDVVFLANILSSRLPGDDFNGIVSSSVQRNMLSY